MRKSVCLITAFVVFILQATVLPFIFNGSTQPNLIFLFVVLMSLHYGKKVAIITALLGGFTQDVVLGNWRPPLAVFDHCHDLQLYWPVY